MTTSARIFIVCATTEASGSTALTSTSSSCSTEPRIALISDWKDSASSSEMAIRARRATRLTLVAMSTDSRRNPSASDGLAGRSGRTPPAISPPLAAPATERAIVVAGRRRPVSRSAAREPRSDDRPPCPPDKGFCRDCTAPAPAAARRCLRSSASPRLALHPSSIAWRSPMSIAMPSMPPDREARRSEPRRPTCDHRRRPARRRLHHYCYIARIRGDARRCRCSRL